MTAVVQKSQNPVLQAAWAGHIAAQKAEAKAAKPKPEPTPAPARKKALAVAAHKKAAEAVGIVPGVHKKAPKRNKAKAPAPKRAKRK